MRLSAREIAACIFFLFAFFFVVSQCMGCGPSDQVRAANAQQVAAYDLELVHCKEQGKASGSFAVFEACERGVSRRLCLDRPELRTIWPRCKEVGVLP